MLESFSDKFADLIASTLLKETPAQVLSCEFYVIFNRTFFVEQLRTATIGNVIIFNVSSGAAN